MHTRKRFYTGKKEQEHGKYPKLCSTRSLKQLVENRSHKNSILEKAQNKSFQYLKDQ